MSRLSSGFPRCVTLNEKAPAIVRPASGPPKVPPGVIDFDRENWDDPIQVSHYTMDIFNYLKSREVDFVIEKYMTKQKFLNPWMRTLLVDWMVEVQETFELNHETLYLAVKIVDMYLSKVQVEKEKLQLVGAASMFLACKYDERTPPLIDDFLYICDGAYNQQEMTKMEMLVFKTIGFDLGFPLSYRFLRRYARVRCTYSPHNNIFHRISMDVSLTDSVLPFVIAVCQIDHPRAHSGSLHSRVQSDELRNDLIQRFENGRCIAVHGIEDDQSGRLEQDSRILLR